MMSEQPPADPDREDGTAADLPAVDASWPPPPGQRKPGKPISTAGSGLPFGISDEAQAGAAAASRDAHSEPAEPAPAKPERGPGAPSTAPPGFSQEPAVVASVSTTEAAPPASADDELEPIAGSLLLARFARLWTGGRRLLPHRDDLRRFGVDRAATVRLSAVVVIAALLLAFVVPPLLRALEDVPILGPAADQLRSLSLYPSAYGLMWVLATLTVVCAAGLVVTQMERTAHDQQVRHDPARRLNIGLTGLLVFAGAAALLMLLNRYGWAAAGSATCFWVALWLVVPVGRTPGALALAHQSPFTWVLLTITSLVGVVWAPSLPLLVFTFVVLMRLLDSRAALASGADPAPDPVDRVNRISGGVIVIGVLVLSVVGLKAMTLHHDEIVRPAHERPPELQVSPPDGESLPNP